MIRTRARRPVVVASLVGIALVASLSADHSWGGYHWARTSNPFTLMTGDNVSSAWDSYLDDAIYWWSLSSVLDLQEVGGGPTQRTAGPRPVGSRYAARRTGATDGSA